MAECIKFGHCWVTAGPADVPSMLRKHENVDFFPFKVSFGTSCSAIWIVWYHSGPKLRPSDQEINDLFKRFISRPVIVIVDVRLYTAGIPTDA
jgi:proteasome lid subunit RPN8/RPN11